MAIKCTVTTDLQAKDTSGYSGIQKHVEHDEKIKHSNQDIVFSETQFNVYDESTTTRQEVEQWNEQHFQDYVAQHDQHQRAKGHAERQYGSVKNYLKRKKKATAVLTIGNMAVQSALMKQFCPASSYQEEKLPDGTTHLVFKLKDENGQPIQDNIAAAKKFYGCFNQALIRATNNNAGWSFKDKNKPRVTVGDYLHRGRYATNNDEMGISHIHYELATFGMTRGGKKRAAHATNSLNQALVSLHQAVTGKTVSGRDAIKWYRANVDQFALKCLEQELHKTYKVPAKTKILDFERKTKEDKAFQTGLSMEQFKAQHQEIADHQKEVQTLQDQAQTLNNQNNDVQTQVETVTKNLKTIYEAATGQQAVDKAGNDLSPLEMANGITKAAKHSQENKRQAEDDIQAAEEQRKAAEQQQANANRQLASLRNQLNTIQDDINDTDEQLKQRKFQRIKAAQQEIADNNLSYTDHQPIKVTASNVVQIEQTIDDWRETQRTQWKNNKTSYTKQLTDLNKQLTKAKSKKSSLDTTNQDLQAKNAQLKQANQTILNDINGYKVQLVDTITENDPSHKVEQPLLQPNEVAQPVSTNAGRQQHLHQTLKYLIDTTTKVLQKVKTEALDFIKQITKTLIQPTKSQEDKPIPQHSAGIDPSSIQKSNKPINHRQERKLEQDPIIQLKKALLLANHEQLQKADQQIKQSTSKQVDDEWQF